MAAILLSRREYERIKRLASDEEVRSDSQLRREKLRQLSKERESKWPNTLAAQRRVKYEQRQKREAQLEKERQEVDNKEQAIRSAQRKAAIAKAKRQMYEQKDRIKGFRSQQLLADVLKEQRLQQDEKVASRDYEKRRDAYFHEMTMAEVKRGDEKEARDVAARRAKAKDFAKMQLSQLKVYTQRHIDKLVQERIEGQLVLENAKKGIEEEERKQAERRRQARQNNIEMKQANERLKLVREKDQIRLKAEEDKIVEYAKQRDLIKAKRKSHQRKKQAEKQRQVQQMIDRAVEHLAAMQNNEDHRLEREVEQKKEKDEAKLRAKAEYRRKHWEAIDRSRKAQIAEREANRADAKRKDVEMKHNWAAQRDALIEQEKKEKAVLRQRKKDLATFVINQRGEKKSREEAEKQELLRQAHARASARRVEEEEFNEFLQGEIEKAQREGKNVEIIKKALVEQDEIKGFVFY